MVPGPMEMILLGGRSMGGHTLTTLLLKLMRIPHIPSVQAL